MQFTIRPIQPDDRAMILHLWETHWGAPVMVSRGQLYQVEDLGGFVAFQGDMLAGLVTYHLDGDACEVMSLDSLIERNGIGTALLKAVYDAAVQARCRRLWLITTNDNTAALRFYQKRGWVLVALHCDAMIESRRLKPQIPLTGNDGIPIRDELELEMLLNVQH
jgi:GNAT superfamily N-acetyltransferase